MCRPHQWDTKGQGATATGTTENLGIIHLLKNMAEDVHDSYDVARKNGRIIKAYKSHMNGPSSPESRKVKWNEWNQKLVFSIL